MRNGPKESHRRADFASSEFKNTHSNDGVNGNIFCLLILFPNRKIFLFPIAIYALLGMRKVLRNFQISSISMG